jgi:hypothetical protein
VVEGLRRQFGARLMTWRRYIAAGGCANCPSATRITVGCVTPREKLHRLVDELNDAEVHAALVLLEREREAVRQWAEAENTDVVEDAWALSNAREAIREEPW